MFVQDKELEIVVDECWQGGRDLEEVVQYKEMRKPDETFALERDRKEKLRARGIWWLPRIW